MWWELPKVWVTLLNVVGWPVIQVTISYFITRADPSRFSPESFFFRPRAWEKEGEFYARFFGVRVWKKKLPDAAAWFDQGFPKARLRSKDPQYYSRFMVETCRGEWAHWLMLGASPIFYLWNPLWAFGVMVLAGLFLNLPCILVQRFNRNRLHQILANTSRLSTSQTG